MLREFESPGMVRVVMLLLASAITTAVFYFKAEGYGIVLSHLIGQIRS